MREKVVSAEIPDYVCDIYADTLKPDTEYNAELTFEVEDDVHRLYSCLIFHRGVDDESFIDITDDLSEDSQIELIQLAIDTDEYEE